MAYVEHRLRTALFRVALAFSQPAGHPERLSQTDGLTTYPAYSPDGTRIAYLSNRSGAMELWVSANDGSRPIQLTSFAGPMLGPPSWSPDGGSIAFDCREQGNSEIYVIDSGTGRVRQITHDASPDTSPSWSRDGHWIYFSSLRTGRDEVWKVAASGGPPVRVTTSGGTYFRESPWGRSFYLVKSSSPNSLWILDGDVNNERQIVNSLGFPQGFGFHRGLLYFISSPVTQAHATIALWNPQTGTPITVSRIERPAPGFSVSPDGRYFLLSQVVEDDAELMLAENLHR